jgi:hypothetical protein
LSKDKKKLISRLMQLSIGLACAFFFLAISVYRAPLADIGAVLAHTSILLLGAAIAVYAANLALRAWRWQLILSSGAAVPYLVVTRVLLVGYGLNNILPARLGELFRAEFLTRTAGIARLPGLASIVIERTFDGIAVVACLGIGLLLAGETRQSADPLVALLLGGGILFGAALASALALGRLRFKGLIRRFPGLSDRIVATRQGFAILRTRRCVLIAGLTLIIYVPDTLSLWLIVKSLGLGLGFGATLVLAGTASLSTLLPSGPAFFGTLQFAYMLAIEFAGGQAAVGVAAATLAQLSILLPVSIVAALLLAHGARRLLFGLIAEARSRGPAAAPRVGLSEQGSRS